MSYSPTLGRWVTPDPIGYAAGDDNLYRFVENNAVNLTDPSGLAPNQAGAASPADFLEQLRKRLREKGRRDRDGSYHMPKDSLGPVDDGGLCRTTG
ncbi:MAG: hypothetical protein K2X82_12105 [Gemmataceae bacterium]|nr:hypothetical protein [Gemmataceae bacterium]